jgi:hypothetical protein
MGLANPRDTNLYWFHDGSARTYSTTTVHRSVAECATTTASLNRGESMVLVYLTDKRSLPCTTSWMSSPSHRCTNILLLVATVFLSTATHAVTPRPQFFFQNLSMPSHLLPVSDSTRGVSETNAHTIKTVTAAIENATSIAQGALEHVCPGADFSIAPVELRDLSSGGQRAPVMSIRAPFVLMNVTSVVDRMGYVYVPTALARWLLRADSSNTVVWDSGDISPDEEARALSEMWASIPHDLYVTVNTQTDFAIGDADCDTVGSSGGSYSFISVMMHEIVHGMGVYSLVDPDRGGGMQGHLGIFDAFMKTTADRCAGGPNGNSTACFLFDSDGVQDIAGHGLAGQPVWMNTSRVYNPATFNPGSSLSHFEVPSSVMQHSIGHSTCRFRVSPGDVAALVQMGWDTCRTPSADYEWDATDMLISSRVLQDITNSAPGSDTRVDDDDRLQRMLSQPTNGWIGVVLACVAFALICYSCSPRAYRQSFSGSVIADSVVYRAVVLTNDHLPPDGTISKEDVMATQWLGCWK